jgi:alpha-1,2-mannosyltransferase
MLDGIGIAVLAFALRLGIVLFSNGGARGIFGYDAGVYYSAADALIHGRVPYRDFIFLHPPGIMVALAPFAALGRLTTDPTGYIVANVFFNALAAVNAVLVWVIARRWGLDRRAALVGGLFYAVWWGAINAEVGVRLEPLSAFLFLLGITLLAGREPPSREPHSRGRSVAAGAALAGACCVKIWWVVPLLVVVGWYLARRSSRRSGGFLALGAGVAGALVTVPFLALAPGQMWHRVVSDQLGRRYGVSPLSRVQSLTGLRKAFPGLPTSAVVLAAAVVALVFVAVIVVAWRRAPARMVVAVLVAQFAVLMVSPSFFSFYSGYLAGSLALTVAAAAQPTPQPRPVGARVGWLAATVATVVTLGALAHSSTLVDPFPGRQFERATTGLHCVMTDSNSALILMNRLSTDLADGCPNWVDVTGHTYFGPAKTQGESRPRNTRWQADLRQYLLSGDAVVTIRPGTGMSAATRRIVQRHPVLARGDGFVLYAVRRGG